MCRKVTDNLLQGDFSARVESMNDDAVKEEVLDVLRSMYPNTTIPEPDAFYFPRWKSDPLYRGSYSNWPSSFLKAHHINLRATVDGRLWFGGEATSLKYFGTFRIVRVTLSALYDLPGVAKRLI